MALTQRDKKNSTQAGDYASIWGEIRAVLNGQSKEVCQAYVVNLYKKASVRRSIRTHHYPVMGYICDTAASAFTLPLRVANCDKPTRDTVVGWRPTFDLAWRARMASGLSLLHLRQGEDNEWLVEQLWPDQVLAVEDPRYPGRWDRALKVTLAVPSGELIYERQVDGSYLVIDAPTEAPINVLGSLPALPIVAWSRRPLSSLLPPPDSTILDLHVSTAIQLSQTEFRMRFRTAQMYRKSEMVLENQIKGGSDIDSNPDAVLELGKDDSVGLLESALRATDDLSYITDCLKLATRMLGLCPEMWDQTSRSETGAARAYDWRPILLLEQRDRAQADEALADMFSAWAPILGSGWESIRARTSPPKTPDPADRASHAAGVRAEMELGLTTPIKEIARKEGIGFEEAKKLWDENMKMNKSILGNQAGEPTV